jgi:alpha-L-fucosidase 2
MDLQLLRDVLNHAIEASSILGVDAADRARWEEMRRALPRTRIGKDGRLQEWSMEVEETEPGHRHLSHLIGLHPGDEFDEERTPELYAAAARTLDYRLAHFDGLSGWSLTWVGCMCARLGRGDEAFHHLRELTSNSTGQENADMPLGQQSPRIFQIDTNLGCVAVLTEMLLQSRRGELQLLPALPSAWPEGAVRGMRAKGGLTVDMEWAGGRLRKATIRAVKDTTCVVRDLPDHLRVWCGGKAVAVARRGNRAEFPIKAAAACEISEEPEAK